MPTGRRVHRPMRPPRACRRLPCPGRSRRRADTADDLGVLGEQRHRVRSQHPAMIRPSQGPATSRRFSGRSTRSGWTPPPDEPPPRGCSVCAHTVQLAGRLRASGRAAPATRRRTGRPSTSPARRAASPPRPAAPRAGVDFSRPSCWYAFSSLTEILRDHFGDAGVVAVHGVVSGGRLACADSRALRAAGTSSSNVTRRFVPCVMVIGRSVLGRTVRHGTQDRRLLLEPTRVRDHRRRPRTAAMKSMYPSGSRICTPGWSSSRRPGRFARPRGCTGMTRSARSATPCRCRTRRTRLRRVHVRGRCGRQDVPPGSPMLRPHPRCRRSPGSPAACRSSGCRPGASGTPGRLGGQIPDPSGLVTRHSADSWSVTRRFTSSGMVMSSSSSRPPHGRPGCAVWPRRAAAMVEFTSPYNLHDQRG